MQRREQRATDHDHQAAKPGQQPMLYQVGVGAHGRDVGLQRSFGELQIPADLFDIGLGRDFVVDQVDNHAGNALGLGPLDAFQDEAGPPFFVLSLKAGGTGLNLTAASHVVHFDRWWNPAVENQATDRAFRIGQKRNVLVHKLVCRGTVEERIDALIASKRALADSVVEGGAEVNLTSLPNDALMRLVSLDLASALSEES